MQCSLTLDREQLVTVRPHIHQLQRVRSACSLSRAHPQIARSRESETLQCSSLFLISQ
jgi:hypothetical protein